MGLATEKRCCQWMQNNRGKMFFFFSLNMESLSLLREAHTRALTCMHVVHAV